MKKKEKYRRKKIKKKKEKEKKRARVRNERKKGKMKKMPCVLGFAGAALEPGPRLDPHPGMGNASPAHSSCTVR